MLSVARVIERAPVVAPDFAQLRQREFGRLDVEGHAYLDYTGSALYPRSLVAAHASMLSRSILGNPHAENPASLASSACIAEARERVLQFLDADPTEYAVCFTANATAAIGLVAAGYRFGADTPLVLTADNHNSVNGIREYARRAGASVHYLPLDHELRLDSSTLCHSERSQSSYSEQREGSALRVRGLFAYPAQSNFSGVKHPLSLVGDAQSVGYRVLLDAAALVPMTRLSLRDVPADFVALSFYKMFGYPTGVGALVAKRDALAELDRPWFSGGTVEFVSVQNRMHALRSGEEGFEDGTANFLDIAAIPAGLDHLESLGLENIERHATGLALELVDMLGAARHRNGQALTDIHGPKDGLSRGATVAFNVLDDTGAVVPYALVEQAARDARVSVRGGCFCNPGASEAAFRFPAAETMRCLTSAKAEGWSLERFGECMRGYAVGAVRASFGAPSNAWDLRRLMAVVESFAT
ncbi:MAG: aminotransferase class [Gemmatimonadetes bacterium]|nr:aminotransferase class [Gemmatimonadota bacterium]